MSNGRVVGQLKGAKDPFSIEWEIADFLSLSANVDQQQHSPTYFFSDSSWHLGLYPNGEKLFSSEGYIGVYVYRLDSGPPVTATWSLSFKKTDGRKEVVNKSKQTFNGNGKGWGNAKAIRRSELIEKKSEFLPAGVFTIMCSLKCDIEGIESKEVALQTSECGNPPLFTPNTKLLGDFEKLLLSEEGCDVTLQVKEQKFKAHQIILGARSSVFASMLKHDMKEKNTGLINIEDCEPENFPNFLRFLYCGNLDSITSQNMCSLYRAADKYDVQDLMSQCLAFIKSHISVDNICDIITLALQHNEADLIKQATDFFAKNLKTIILTVKWQVFLDENPTQSNELLIKALAAYERSNP